MLTPHRLVDLFFASHQLYVLVLVLLIKNGELNPHMRKARLLTGTPATENLHARPKLNSSIGRGEYNLPSTLSLPLPFPRPLFLEAVGAAQHPVGTKKKTSVRCGVYDRRYVYTHCGDIITPLGSPSSWTRSYTLLDNIIIRTCGARSASRRESLLAFSGTGIVPLFLLILNSSSRRPLKK